MATNSREHFGLESFDSKMLSATLATESLGWRSPFFLNQFAMSKKSFFFSATFLFFLSFNAISQSFTPDMDDTTTTPTFEQIYQKIVRCDGRIQGGMDITTNAASITVYWTPKKIVEDVYLTNGDIVITTITAEKCTRRVKLQADTEPKEDVYFSLQKQKDSMERISRNFTCVPEKKE